MKTRLRTLRSRRPPRAKRRFAVPAVFHRLIRVAERVRRRAYAPYSLFPVGAAVLTSGGTIFPGCNVENASSGLTQCAERVAVQCAVVNGRRRMTAVAVAGPPGITPCGACRQVMHEFGVKTVILASPGAPPIIVPLQELLPRPYTRKRLPHARL